MNMNWRGVLPRIGAAVMAVGMTFGVAATANAASSSISPIYDAAEMLTSAQEAELALGLESESQKSGLVFAVDTVGSLKGQSLEEYAKERANELEIGDSEKDNSVLFVITREEREVRIQLADGVTDFVSDDDTQEVVDGWMVPLLRTGNYFDAVIAGADQVGYLYQSGANAMTPEEAAQNVEAGRVVDMWIYSIGGGIIGVILLALGIGGINSRRRRNQEEKSKERRITVRTSAMRLVGTPEEAAFMSLKDQEARTAFITDRLSSAITEDRKLAEEAPELFFAMYMEVKAKQVQKEMNYSAIDLAHSLSDAKLWSGQSIQTALDEFRAKCLEGRATMDRINKAVVERGKQRLKEKAEQDKADRKAAKKMWSQLDRGAKKEIRAARTKREKQRIVSQYADPSVNVSLLFPVMYGLYASSMGDAPESRSSSSSSSSYGSSSSSSSSSSYSSSSSDYSGGSSFSDGGASGSY
jgi:uncharacterized membrane protein YgcG